MILSGLVYLPAAGREGERTRVGCVGTAKKAGGAEERRGNGNEGSLGNVCLEQQQLKSRKQQMTLVIQI